ncbi:MAG TPA: NAD(P)H-dependent oxidoreductase [Steroidobacteraceae bacterium]|nr:NAD(P)H-dependent oxidoreductase [Steroidobacteraceae bacterium]
MRRILIIDGHPDCRTERYVHALSKAYCDGARSAGHKVESIIVSELEFPLLRRGEDFQSGEPPAVIRRCQEQIAWAEHLVILYPLWLGSMPGLLKAFFEQVLRPGFAFAPARGRGFQKKLLGGRSARIFVTMGMPALFYRWYFRAHSLKTLERNILAFCGIAPVRASLIGMVEAMDSVQRGRWLARAQAFGVEAR